MKNLTIKRGHRDGFRRLFLTGKITAILLFCTMLGFGAASDSQNKNFSLEFNGKAEMQAAQQTKNLSGIVRNEDGSALPSVTVIVKGTTIGVTTDFDGKFNIEVPQNAEALVFSFIGMQAQEVAIGNQQTFEVIMSEDALNIEEVIAIGYGTMKKSDLTGAVTSVSSEEVTIAPTNNVMEALQGRVAGMDIVKTSGQIGSDVEILLRGSRSIYGDNSPLFIIDGIPGSYNQINPSDIESVDILKDASSTAIYGSSGSNGVVIITTKRGKEGKATVNFDAHYGVSGTPEFLHGMTGQEWTSYQRESYKYINGDYPVDMSSILTDAGMYNAYNNNQWIDWVDEAIGDGATNQKYNLSVTGGTDKTKIYSGINYVKDEGLLPNESLERYAIRMNIDQELGKYANAGFTTNINYSDMDRGVKNTFTKALSSFPLGEAYDEEGQLIHEYANGQYSPLSDFIENQFVNNTRSIYANAIAFLEVLPFKGLSIKSVVNGTLSNARTGQYWGEQANANRPSYAGSPHASITNNSAYSYTWENIASYKATLAQDHSLAATFVTSYASNVHEGSMASGSGQELDSWTFYRLASATSQRIESSFSKTNKMSYAARLNYSYKGKYLLTLSNRWDGVSWFSEGNKWDFFPAGALAWRISDEAFMDFSDEWLNNLKLRVGYGKTGNSGGVSAYSTHTNAYAYTGYGVSVDGEIAPFTQYTGTYGNPSLGWEKSYNMNIGLDFALLDGRIDGAVEYFNTKTTDLLFKRTMPITSGVTGWGAPLSSWENIAETSNKGIEVTLNSTNIQTKDFRWNTTLSFTHNNEQIDNLPGGDLISESLFVGSPINSIYGYKYQGIWGTDASAEELEAYGVKPGWIKLETVEQEDSDDGGVHKYSADDKQIIGHSNPNVVAGLNNTITYRDFDFTVFVMGRFGQTIESDLIGWYSAKPGATTNQPSGIDYWTENNQTAYFPVPGSGSEQSEFLSAYTYQDGSFMKIKNVTLGYTLPKNVSQKIMMSSCRIFATAYNPYIWIKSKQLQNTDPETNGSDAFPLYKQFVFGVNITF
ncbi:SusC/RagA family TonB-linked outer membrane protein [Roseimarinus sediminis]|uniref:SusC/RagA family TonB-linked outer membrane protein n=1 Tax=Roseimarinus sediminis TaxID=1610899 RepID=UPI003D237C77